MITAWVKAAILFSGESLSAKNNIWEVNYEYKKMGSTF
jgi:hypothetical protein